MQTTLKAVNKTWWKPLLGLLGVGLWLFGASLALADASQDDLNRINVHVEQALAALKANNLALAQTEFNLFDDGWFDIEDGVRAKSKDTYRSIEDRMNAVKDVLSVSPLDPQALQRALENLNKTNLAYIAGTTLPGNDPTGSTAATTGPAPGTPPTVASLLNLLTIAQNQQSQGDWAGASTTIKTFQDNWPDVEGQIKTRSAEAYKNTENDMALAYSLSQQKSPDLKNVLARMASRLEPFKDATTYGIFDATIILLREGLEALLVVVALLAFLKKSGNTTNQSWIWSGAVAGLAASIALGIAIQALFASAVNSSNREMLEGVTGLVASVMLIYVSYWMHNKSSAAAWNRYIKSRTTAVLARGSLFGLAALAFLAIFREGAETVLFFLGMGSNISASDLFIGLAIGAVLLAIIGFLLVVVGMRIPMGPFFRVASILVFYLCFKFVGTGVHSLQVGSVLSATPATYLPENGFFGLYPTWETTIAQLALLLIGAGLVLFNHYKSNKEAARTARPVEPGQSSVIIK